jgi:hypothetical protein
MFTYIKNSYTFASVFNMFYDFIDCEFRYVQLCFI